METQPVIRKQERIDDVPLLFGMMRRMKINEIIDNHLGRHHLHQGLSNGNLAIGWLAYILSQSDHRKSAVEEWANQLQQTLESLYGTPLRPHEFGDDRLGILLTLLAEADSDALERDLFVSCFEVHELPTDSFRLDTTASCGYHTITPDGIMQLGHSKDHRPDLPQLKIMAAVTQPLAFPVSTAVVPGNQADDVLYWPTIQQVQGLVGHSGLLFSGDCKMAALDTRARIDQAKDFYLTPLPQTGQTAQLFDSWVEQALAKGEGLSQVWQPRAEDDPTEPELMARGYEFTRTLKAKVENQEHSWSERVQVVQSIWLWDNQKERLEKKLQQAEEKLGVLTLTGPGRCVWRDELELSEAVAAILKETNTVGLLEVEWDKHQTQTTRYAGRGRPGPNAAPRIEEEVRYQIRVVRRNKQQIEHRHERLGWRVQVTNASEQKLSFEASVLTYREGAALERPFHQLKDLPLGIRPLFVRKPEQVKGLTRLLLIALRVMTLVEIVVRSELAKTGEKLDGLYEGQKNKKEGRPTAKRLLSAIARLQMTLTKVTWAGGEYWTIPPLPALLLRTLALLGLAPSLYTDLGNATRSVTPAASGVTAIPIASG